MLPLSGPRSTYSSSKASSSPFAVFLDSQTTSTGPLEVSKPSKRTITRPSGSCRTFAVPTVSCSRETKVPLASSTGPAGADDDAVPDGAAVSSAATLGSASSTRLSKKSFCGWNQIRVTAASTTSTAAPSQIHVLRRRAMAAQGSGARARTSGLRTRRRGLWTTRRRRASGAPGDESDQPVDVPWSVVPDPGDVLVGPDQHQAGTVVGTAVGEAVPDHREWHAQGGRGAFEGGHRGLRGIQSQERVSRTERVEHVHARRQELRRQVVAGSRPVRVRAVSAGNRAGRAGHDRRSGVVGLVVVHRDL